MTLEEVLEGVPLQAALPAMLRGRLIRGVEYDSRKVEPDFLFFAFAGERADGRAFAQQAMEQGAAAVVSDLPPLPDFAGPWILVSDLRRCLSRVSGNFFGHPDRRLFLSGFTGTNGKTTSAIVCDEMLRSAGLTTALIGTIEYRIGAERRKAPNTTPESLDIYGLLQELEQLGGTHAVMEVSSHALALGRVHGMQFHTAVFSNFTQDHLDFHTTMDAYFAAKEMLFRGEELPPPRFAVINADDPVGERLRVHSSSELIWYTAKNEARARGTRILAEEIESSFAGLRFAIQGEGFRVEVNSPLSGRFNVYNILAAFGVGLTYGLSPEAAVRGVESCRRVPGRFERVDEGQPFLVVVDFAHTDDALENLILGARELEPKRVITLFGCGGDRDRTKRPRMGQTAAKLSDFVVVTSDNPRSEDPLAIINDALVGLRRCDTPHIVEPDRRKAIRKALEEARAGDMVLLAGKGHETYQILGDRTIHFDDREEAADLLRSMGFKRESE